MEKQNDSMNIAKSYCLAFLADVIVGQQKVYTYVAI